MLILRKDVIAQLHVRGSKIFGEPMSSCLPSIQGVK